MKISNQMRVIQKQNLNFQMSLRIQQSNILAMSQSELLDKIREDCQSNPALQVIEKDPSPGNLGKEQKYNENRMNTHSTSGRLNKEASDNKQKFMENGIATETTLQDYLLQQLHFQSLDEKELSVGERLITNLNENGFYRILPEYFYDLREGRRLFEPEEKEIVESMESLIRSFDPPGICVSNAHESLIVQCELNPLAPEEIVPMLREHWEHILKKNFEKICKLMNLSPGKMEVIKGFMKTLNPYPGASFARRSHVYITPDIIIKRNDGAFDISLHDDHFPTLTIDPLFKEMSHSSGVKRGEKGFFTNNVNSAKEVIKLLNYRNSTLLKVCKAIFQFQLDYFLKGPEHVAPLTLQDVSDEVGLDPSTISRVVKNKYIQTDNGIFPLKYFFASPVPSHIPGHPGFSNIEVMFRIKRILDRTDCKVSDSEITRELVEKGVKINRRTVNKYRNRVLLEWN